MPNKNYLKGRAKEQRIKRKLEKEGYICIRSAGSKSFADIICIDRNVGIVRFIQCKPKNFSEKKKKELLKKYCWLFNILKCSFEVI